MTRLISEAGRWKGALTCRPLPLHDPSIDLLSDVDRRHLAEVWLGRAASERRVADSFEAMGVALRALRADAALVTLADRAVDDEHRHAEISRVVASRFAGTELAQPNLLALRIPAHEGASDELRHALHVVGHCTLNETTAGAFLETCIHHATGPLASAALRELLSDEVDHARMGWTLLAASSAEIRSGVGQWIYPMARANLRMWRESPRPPSESPTMSAHGAPPMSVIDEALLAALRDLIVPGLRAVGIATERIDAWLARGASTAPLEA